MVSPTEEACSDLKLTVVQLLAELTRVRHAAVAEHVVVSPPVKVGVVGLRWEFIKEKRVRKKVRTKP